MQTFGQTEIDHHDLTNQENEPQEKNISESVKLVSRPVSVLNKEELNHLREKGKNIAVNNDIILILSLGYHVTESRVKFILNPMIYFASITVNYCHIITA